LDKTLRARTLVDVVYGDYTPEQAKPRSKAEGELTFGGKPKEATKDGGADLGGETSPDTSRPSVAGHAREGH
jgi:hypothetical protein